MSTKFEKENEEKTLKLFLERTTCEQNKMRKFLKTPVVFSDPSLFSPVVLPRAWQKEGQTNRYREKKRRISRLV